MGARTGGLHPGDLVQHQGGAADELIARIASRSHGVVTRQNLLGRGITLPEIRTRLARGSLIVVHRGVYRVGHRAPSLEARYLAAVLACGDTAPLSRLPAQICGGWSEAARLLPM